jgi:hypothetical protein
VLAVQDPRWSSWLAALKPSGFERALARWVVGTFRRSRGRGLASVLMWRALADSSLHMLPNAVLGTLASAPWVARSWARHIIALRRPRSRATWTSR